MESEQDKIIELLSEINENLKDLRNENKAMNYIFNVNTKVTSELSPQEAVNSLSRKIKAIAKQF